MERSMPTAGADPYLQTCRIARRQLELRRQLRSSKGTGPDLATLQAWHDDLLRALCIEMPADDDSHKAAAVVDADEEQCPSDTVALAPQHRQQRRRSSLALIASATLQALGTDPHPHAASSADHGAELARLLPQFGLTETVLFDFGEACIDKLAYGASTASVDPAAYVAELLASEPEFERAAPLLRPLLSGVVARVKPMAKMANWGLLGRLLLGLAFTYGDLVSDALVTALYWERSTDSELGVEARGVWHGYFVTAVVFVVVPLLMQGLFTAFILRQSRTDVALALVGLKPEVDSWRVFRGKAPHQSEEGAITWSQETVLMGTKWVEAIFECFPQGILQLICVLATPWEQRTPLMVVSLATSLCATAFTLYTGSIDADRDPAMRKIAPHLHGWSGDEPGKLGFGRRFALAWGMMGFFVGHLACTILGLAVLGVTGGLGAVGLTLGMFCALFHLAKVVEGEYLWLICPHTLWRRSVLRWAVVGGFKNTLMFLAMFGAPVPIARLPGFVNPHVWAGTIATLQLGFAPACIAIGLAWVAGREGEAQDDSAYAAATDGSHLAASAGMNGSSPCNGDTPATDACNDESSRGVEASSTELLMIWAVAVLTSLVGAALFWFGGMERRFRNSFYRYDTFRRLLRKSIDADEDIDVSLSARDPYYWPPPAYITSNEHFQRLWAEWRERPPAWLTEEWKEALPAAYYEAFYGGGGSSGAPQDGGGVGSVLSNRVAPLPTS